MTRGLERALRWTDGETYGRRLITAGSVLAPTSAKETHRSEREMADFDKPSAGDMAAANPGTDAGTSGSLRIVDWGVQDEYWRDNYGSRPYTLADRGYEYYQPAYKYGHESAFFY